MPDFELVGPRRDIGDLEPAIRPGDPTDIVGHINPPSHPTVGVALEAYHAWSTQRSFDFHAGDRNGDVEHRARAVVVGMGRVK